MKKHLLLIDDDKQMIRTFTEAFTLTDSQYTCTLASDIDHAKKILELISPDLVFVNLDKQVGAVLQFIYLLKRPSKNRNLHVVAFCKHIEYYASTSKGYGVNMHIFPPKKAADVYHVLAGIPGNEVRNFVALKNDNFATG